MARRKRTSDPTGERLRDYLDVADVMLLALDSTGHIEMVNRKTADVLGWTEDDLVGRDWFETCVPQRYRARTREVFQQLMAGNLSPGEYHENPIRTAANKEMLVAWHNSVIRDGVGRITGTISSGVEMTDRAQDARSLQLFRDLIDQTNDAVLVIDPDSARLLEVNQRACDLLGYRRDELRARTVLDLADALPDLGAWQELSDKIRTSGGMIIEGVYRKRDGSTLPVEVSMRYTASAGTEHVVSIVRDISERKRAEEELRRSAIVFENTAEGVMITEPDGTIVSVNRAFCEITGYERDELIGQRPSLLRSGKQSREFYDVMWASLRGAGKWQGEIWNRRKSGEVFPCWINISAVRDRNGEVTNFVEVMADISVIKESEARLKHLAHHDPLTGLPNRLLFHARLEHALQLANREGRNVGVLFLDLDRFKNINDSLGHPAGDRLLKSVASRLLGRLRQGDTVARLGGDEFVVIMQGLDGAPAAAAAARRVFEAFRRPFYLEEQERYVTASAGISLYPEDGTDTTTLLKNADTALYKAKEEGRNNFQFYTEALTEAVFQRLELESRLRRAIPRRELALYYQPQVSLRTGRIVGAEALLRWNDPEHGLVQPSSFVPLAEETGLISAVGTWVMHEAYRQASAWRALGLPDFRVAVNVSRHQLMRDHLVGIVEEILTETKLPPACVELEITESLLTEPPEHTLATLLALRERGVSLAIDDFGTGSSSLTQLKRLPFDRLKIDRSFISRLAEDPDDAAIARAVIALGHTLQLQVIAEGVETAEQETLLRADGCDEVQGFLHGAPVPADEFEELVRKSN